MQGSNRFIAGAIVAVAAFAPLLIITDQAGADTPCENAQVLVHVGRLDQAEQVLSGSTDAACRSAVAAVIDDQRGQAASALSAAQRYDQRFMKDEELQAGERSALLSSYVSVLTHDSQNEAAVARLAELIKKAPAAKAPTDAELVQQLADLGLTDEAKAAVASMVDDHKSVKDVSRSELRTSWWARTWDPVQAALEPALIPISVALLVVLLVILTRLAMNHLEEESKGYRLVVSGKGDLGPQFAAGLRATLDSVDPWRGATASAVVGDVKDLPSFAELGNHFKVVDWALKWFWRWRWNYLDATVLPNAGHRAGAVLEITGRKRSDRTIVRAPNVPDAEKEAMSRLIPGAAAWTAAHWRPDQIGLPDGVGTKRWEALAANLSGIARFEEGDIDVAYAFFLDAVRVDPHFSAATQNVLMARGHLVGEHVLPLAGVLDGFDTLLCSIGWAE